jgi:hypothetical protein
MQEERCSRALVSSKEVRILRPQRPSTSGAARELACIPARPHPAGRAAGGGVRPDTAVRRVPDPVVGTIGSRRRALLELQVPVGTTEAELWFERRETAGISAWDSQCGQNHTFDVSGQGLPISKRSVAPFVLKRRST